MNQFLCSKPSPALGLYDHFETVFKACLENKWEATQFGNVLENALEMISGSLRTLRPTQSLILLAVAFESLFAKDEDDWAGASRRVARLVGRSKGEVTDLFRFLNDGPTCVRKLRNNLVHGELGIDGNLISDSRERFAPIVAEATIALICECLTSGNFSDYYVEMQALADARFDALPNTTEA